MEMALLGGMASDPTNPTATKKKYQRDVKKEKHHGYTSISAPPLSPSQSKTPQANNKRARPNYLIKFSKLDHSTITGLTIKNYPVHGITVSNTRNVTISQLFLDNSSGTAPNAISTPLAAAHNTDGFGLSNSTMVTLTNSTVLNQDDCVAITSGTGYLVSKMLCVGGHGLSIGSIGGKGGGEPDKNQVEDVVFEDCILKDQTNGIRIKTNAGQTGLVRKYIHLFPYPLNNTLQIPFHLLPGGVKWMGIMEKE